MRGVALATLLLAAILSAHLALTRLNLFGISALRLCLLRFKMFGFEAHLLLQSKLHSRILPIVMHTSMQLSHMLLRRGACRFFSGTDDATNNQHTQPTRLEVG
jgi:hypothetical protein